MHLAFPLAASLLYVVGALFFKQATAHGVGVWRTAFISNVVMAVAFLTLLPMGGSFPGIHRLWEPLLVGLLFAIAQLFTFLALDRGDVSVATPVLGVKVILVALFTTLLTREALPLTVWIGAGLSSLGIALLNRNPRGAHRRIALTTSFALLAATGYALFDVLVMKLAPAWGIGRFLPLGLGSLGLWSFLFIPFFRRPLRAIAPAAWRPLLLGSLFFAVQAIFLVGTLAHFGDATAVNIVFSLRGLWSILAVWWIGHWFDNREREQGGRILGWRLAGILLLTAAVVLALV